MGELAFRRGWPDDAKRCSDTVNMHAVAGSWGKWAAIRLHDGGSDGNVYDSRDEAIRHQIHEQYCAYLVVPPDGMTPKAAHAYLGFVRQAHDAGWRLTDPQQIHPLTREDFRAKMRKMAKYG